MHITTNKLKRQKYIGASRLRLFANRYEQLQTVLNSGNGQQLRANTNKKPTD